MKINNVTEISAGDFEKDSRQTVGQLGEILNPFMQQVVELMDKRVGFDNRVENFLSVEFTVDSAGVPLLNNKIKTGKTKANGFSVIAAFNTDNASITATEQPFISFLQLAGGFVEVKKITGLPANQKYLLNIIVY